MTASTNILSVTALARLAQLQVRQRGPADVNDLVDVITPAAGHDRERARAGIRRAISDGRVQLDRGATLRVPGCSATCRQRARRRRRDVITGERERVPPRSRRRTQVERLDAMLGQHRADVIRTAAKYIDIPKAISAPEAPLKRWDTELTDVIQVLGRLRRAIRDELEDHSQEAGA